MRCRLLFFGFGSENARTQERRHCRFPTSPSLRRAFYWKTKIAMCAHIDGSSIGPVTAWTHTDWSTTTNTHERILDQHARQKRCRSHGPRPRPVFRSRSRAGFVTYANLMGQSDRSIARKTPHRSLASLGQYVRIQDAWINKYCSRPTNLVSPVLRAGVRFNVTIFVSARCYIALH